MSDPYRLSPMEIAERRELNRGLGDTLARAFELIATPALFGLGGWLLDRWLGTAPVLTVMFVVLATVGKVVATWYHYVAKMEQLEAALPSRQPQSSRPAVVAERPGPPSGLLPPGVRLEGLETPQGDT
jgi:F0F1-type ATP synthase assembly protein I